MEHFMAVFLGAWISLFGIFFVMALKREYANYTLDTDKKDAAHAVNKDKGGAV